MRSSGIILHITSLPGPYGIGTMGKPAYDFIDFLHAAGQSYWQILPTNPTGYGDSPYQSFSAFAGNHYLIDLPQLISEGLLLKEEADACDWGSDETRVDFGAMYRGRISVLYKAYERFIRMPNREFLGFVKENQSWLQDYALFMAIKEENGDRDWQLWEEPLRLRDPEAIAQCKTRLKYQTVFHYFLQYKFFEQWKKLRAYARKNGISIIGDVPIYVPLDSADVWANPQLFQLNEERRPKEVAGCPPDAFTADGQLWGNPLYNWDVLAGTGYAWWLQRIAAAGQSFDVVRLDHFRGYESYWAVPYGDETARNGHWVKGPGLAFIKAIQDAFPHLSFIAEDLGFLTPEVMELQKASGFPGMKVLQFAFDSREPSNYLPHCYTKNCVCYSGTHDNCTLQQWLDSVAPADREYAKSYLGLNHEEGYAWGVLRGGMSSAADMFIAQMQDYLGLGAEARMNFPGTLSADNWSWRMTDRQITPHLTKKIYDMTKLYCRLPLCSSTKTENP